MKSKKGPHLFLERFPASISNFPPFLINFHPFSIFSLPLFSRYVIKNFPVRSLWGALCPLPVMPLHAGHEHWGKNYQAVIQDSLIKVLAILFVNLYFSLHAILKVLEELHHPHIRNATIIACHYLRIKLFFCVCLVSNCWFHYLQAVKLCSAVSAQFSGVSLAQMHITFPLWM